MIVEGEAEDPLKSRRREVAVVFLDLHGFTGFAETAEPEEVMSVLREYHGEMGRVILSHEGTIERFAGDGMMVCFNDPVPVPDAPARAVRMALNLHARLTPLAQTWRRRGYELQLSAGIAHGYATIGAVGFEGRLDYGAIGTVTNLAAHLCREAQPSSSATERIYRPWRRRGPAYRRRRGRGHRRAEAQGVPQHDSCLQRAARCRARQPSSQTRRRALRRRRRL